ncbi:MAG: LytTR family transcriptional regulator DNA-binding domain-containing protein [Erythrobacter sp.]|uniref:LytTR family DNA-binding domain-containing protein n=1 Tax=Erythrobacter sp. TaxID=1042 RepID=UPI002600EC92|nr:LytTR family DNA-binding domain-containing protein [Erythrobacter sp.]MCM0000858.1 LytTR family transcriptional regulator DNA-binding domain-containing protein [Erythrobacter sp.]
MTAVPASHQRALARRIIIDLAAMTAIGVFLAIIGPFGSIAAPLAERLVTWIGFAWLGYACYRPMQSVAAWGERALALPRWGVLAAAVLVGTVPMTFAVIAVNSLPSGGLHWPSFEVLAGTYFSVLVIGGAVTVLFNLVQGTPRAEVPAPAPLHSSPPMPQPAPPPAPSAPPVAAPPPHPLLDQLPAEIGSAIIALEMEDHYVRVHTMLGSALVLMRMRDAVALLGDLEGMQVHRSWWVARAAVEDAAREGRNVRLRLARGIEAPVARAKIAELRDARWI